MLLDKRWEDGNFATIGRKLGNFHQACADEEHFFATPGHGRVL